MREIKFRGIAQDGKIHIGSLTILTIQFIGIEPGYYISNEAGLPFAYKVDPKTIGQFIGLKGKNGIEIYGGDIVKFRSHPNKQIIAEVYYCNERARFEMKSNYQESSTGRETYDINSFSHITSIEVIGNIHFNLELIK